MNSRSMTRKSLIVAAVMLCLAFAVSTVAQVQTQTTTKSGPATKTLVIENGEVVAVEGNNLFVKMPDGTLRDFPNIPASARVDVDGKQLTVHQLQPGMKLQRATVVSTTPQVVTTIQTVTGKVWHVNPPVYVILTLENGENQGFKIPDGQKFLVDGQAVDAWGLKKGMNVTATKIVETAYTSASQQTHVSGSFPASGTVLIAKGAPTPASSAAGSTAAGSKAAGTSAAGTVETASAQLPKTGSNWALVGILGLLLVSSSFGMAWLRRSRGLRG